MDSKTSRRSHNAEQSSHLPAEIIEEILSGVGVTSLLRFRCISKSWRYLIDSKKFIKNHFQNSTKTASSTHHRVMFISDRSASILKQCSLHTLLEGQSIDPSSPINNRTINQSDTFVVVGFCQGLSCFLLQPGSRFLLWNPATKISMELPKLEHVIPKCGFGWDEMSGAYKVFTAVMSNGEKIGKVYSSKKNSWKTVKDGYGDLIRCCAAGHLVDGRIHWAKVFGDDNDIESFDLETEKFGRIERKYWLYLWLGEVGGCLCLCLCVLCDNPQLNVDVWIMRESWLKLLTIPQVCESKISRFSPPLLGGGANGEILVIYRDTLLVYHPKDEVFSAANNTLTFDAAYVYVESLVSPLSDKNLGL